MTLFKCPGSERVREPYPEEIKCSCGKEVEIFSDEAETSCPDCGRRLTREMPPSCLDWCAYARECVGPEKFARYKKAAEATVKASLKNRLLQELEGYFGKDFKRINHARKVVEFAEKIMEKEKCHYGVVLAAAALHDIGIREAERKYGSSAGHCQEKEGPPVARKILERMGLQKEVIDEVCDIIGHHHSPRSEETENFKVLNDADWLVNLGEEVSDKSRENLEKAIGRFFLTETGRKIAGEIYL